MTLCNNLVHNNVVSYSSFSCQDSQKQTLLNMQRQCYKPGNFNCKLLQSLELFHKLYTNISLFKKINILYKQIKRKNRVK